MAETVVKLSRRYEAHGETFDSVTLREPKLRDHFAIGDPVEMHRDPNGGDARFVVEHLDRVQAYLDRLVVKPAPAAVLGDLDLVDSLAVREAVRDFFLDAHTRRLAPTNSSGAPASP
jgi:hypothetical protein